MNNYSLFIIHYSLKMFTPFSKIFLTLWPIKLHYYWLIYVFWITFCFFIIKALFKEYKINVTKSQFENIFFTTMISGLIWGRLFYIIFYNLSFYLSNPLKILAIWEWGMASHWWFIWAITGLYIISRIYKLNFLKIADIFVIPLGIALMFWRFWNLINGELIWRTSNLPWCINYDDICRHPSQIYAALKNLTIFIILFSLRKKILKKWIIFSLFIILYSSFRFIVEFWRKPDSHIWLLIFNLSQWQIISLLMLITWILIYFLINKRIYSN